MKWNKTNCPVNDLFMFVFSPESEENSGTRGGTTSSPDPGWGGKKEKGLFHNWARRERRRKREENMRWRQAPSRISGKVLLFNNPKT